MQHLMMFESDGERWPGSTTGEAQPSFLRFGRGVYGWGGWFEVDGEEIAFYLRRPDIADLNAAGGSVVRGWL